jgi:hypothetical protein
VNTNKKKGEMDALTDDALYTIGNQLCRVRFLGDIALVMFARTCHRHKQIMEEICKWSEKRWRHGFKTFYAWQIPNFETAPDTVHSPVFSSRHGHQWRLLLFPRGNKVKDRGPSLYLEVANSVFLPEGWSREVNFVMQLTAVHGADILTDQTLHTFTDQFNDWGYRTLISGVSIEEFKERFLTNDVLQCCVEIHCRPHLPNPMQSPRPTIPDTVVKYIDRHAKWSELLCANCNTPLRIYVKGEKDTTLLMCVRAECRATHTMEDVFGRLSRLLQPSINLMNPDFGVDASCVASDDTLVKGWRSHDPWLLFT